MAVGIDRRSIVIWAGLAVLLASCSPSETSTKRVSTTRSTEAGPTPTSAGPTLQCDQAPPSSSGFQVLSWTFATATEGWALGTSDGAQPGCALIVRTTDGGHSWQAPVSLRGSVANLDDTQPCGAATCVWGLRFANQSDGYAFGPDLLVTMDAGATWRKEPSLPVSLLKASDGIVVKVVSPCGLADVCADTVQTAPAGSSVWRTLDPPQDKWRELVLVGRSTLYLLGLPYPQTGPSFADLWRSVDGGTTWVHLSDPCAHLPTQDPAFSPPGQQPGYISRVAAVGSTVAVSCVSQQIGPQSAGYNQGFVVSHDNGSTWGPFHSVPHLSGWDSSSGIYSVALASTATVVVVGSEGGVQSSFDDGVTWTTTLPQAASATAFAEAGFENASQGHVVFPDDTFWTTSNGGRSWTPYLFTPSSSPTGSVVLLGAGIGGVRFGEAQGTAIAQLTTMLGPPVDSQPQSEVPDNCGVDGEMHWPALTIYFGNRFFVGYQTSSSSATGPNVTTAVGLRLGDTIAQAMAIYGKSFEASLAQGGSWFASTPDGTIDGYLTGEPNPSVQPPSIASISAGTVGCPAASP